MKYLNTLAFAGLLLSTITVSNVGYCKELSFKEREIIHVINTIQPHIDKKLKYALVEKLETFPENMEWEMFLSILFQESSLNVDPARNGRRCSKHLKTCLDYGIGQVSYKYWGKKLKINRRKALKDPKYSISLSFQVYYSYFKRYSKKDKKWFTRYHSGTPSLRKDYEKRIFSHYGKIIIAQKQFRRSQANVGKTRSDYQEKCRGNQSQGRKGKEGERNSSRVLQDSYVLRNPQFQGNYSDTRHPANVYSGPELDFGGYPQQIQYSDCPSQNRL